MYHLPCTAKRLEIHSIFDSAIDSMKSSLSGYRDTLDPSHLHPLPGAELVTFVARPLTLSDWADIDCSDAAEGAGSHLVDYHTRILKRAIVEIRGPMPRQVDEVWWECLTGFAELAFLSGCVQRLACHPLARAVESAR